MKMYKLFITRVTKRVSPHDTFFIPMLVIVQRSNQLCSFCNFYHRKIPKVVKQQIHTNATTNVLDHLPIKKKVKQRTKKYAEFLAATNETTKSKRIENQSMFVDHFNVITDNSYGIESSILDKNSDLKHVDEDYNHSSDNGIHLNVEDDPNVLTGNKVKEYKDFYNEDFDKLNTCNQIKEPVCQNDSTLHFIKDRKLKMDKKLNSILVSNMNRKVSQNGTEVDRVKKTKYNLQSYISYLLPYMQVYLSCGLFKRANSILMKYRNHAQNNLKCKESIDIYNMLLEAYAFRRKIEKVLELYDTLKKDSLIPTPQTYAYIFDAFGRETIHNNQIVLLKKLSTEMKHYNISFNDIFNKSYFKNDQQNNILRAIRILNANFKPLYKNINISYKCKLMKEIPMKNNYESPVKGLLTMKELKDFSKIQFHNESVIEVQIPNIAVNDKDPKISNLKKEIKELESYWKNKIEAAFERNLKNLKQKENQFPNSSMILYPFLEILDKEQYVNAILREIKQVAIGSETYSTSLKSLYIALGKYIYKKYEIETKKRTAIQDKIINIYLKYLEWYLHPDSYNNMNNRTAWQYFECEEGNHGLSLNMICLNWPIDVIINIGKFLYNIILNDIILQPEFLKGQDVKYSIPAFYTLFRNKGTYLSEQIKSHPFVSKLYKESCSETLTFSSVVLPSYSPPNPWISIYSGGYLTSKTNFMRVSDYNESPLHHLQQIASKQLFPIFDSLNQLSSIPWKVNTTILDIVIKIFRDGGSVKLNIPQSVSKLSPPSPIGKDASIEEKQKASIAMIQYKQKKYEMYSLWCDTVYKLSIANYSRNQIFWLPHNLDFRGRVYPIPPYLNHLSSDMGRSLLLFAKGKPLGPNGLDWLKVHVINLTSLKKSCSIKERLEFADENMENILDSANNPLTGKMWWTKSEEPWQTLAGCIEIANALKAPNIEEYVNTFPVHQDGSCNGLQHYAALGRDQIGAKSVNLYPFNTPKDVYSEVASIVEKQRKMDAKNNNKMAQILKGFVKRKVIKQTVMTTVYGVTKYGAKQQIAKQLKDVVNFPEEYIWLASLYLAENTFHSLRSMFKSAREIQDWLTECARIISNVCCNNVEWITPLGLPIVQPYIKQQKNYKYVRNVEKPDSLKQKNAFAPNFIHSLDSTHMMLTSLYCNQENVTFVSVHDCFWTHPCTVDTMNKICREQFVALHSEPILEDLAKFFIKRYSPIYTKLKTKNVNIKEINKCLTSVPLKGTFDISNVLSSTYFFN